MAELFNVYRGSNVKVTLDFGDGSTYESFLTTGTNKWIEEIQISEKEAETSRDLIGVMESNTLNVVLVDGTGALIKDNRSSPYYGKMVAGVKVTVQYEKNGTLEPLGVYFVDTWTNSADGDFDQSASLYCYDRLSYIGSKEVPALKNSSGLTLGGIVSSIFSGLGLTSGEYNITGINNQVEFINTKGRTVRETLDEVAKAAIARITVDRSGVIQVKPAFSSTRTVVGIINDDSNGSMSIKNNTDVSDYTYVKVNYVDMMLDEVSTELNSLLNLSVPAAGLIKEKIEVPKNTQCIDAVVCRGVTNASNGELIEAADFELRQDGLKIVFDNKKSSTVVIDAYIYGRQTYSSNAFVYNPASPDISKGRMYEVENIYIQNKSIAESYAANLMDYIDTMKSRVSISAYVDFDIKCGTYIQVNSTNASLAGTYYVIGLDFNVGESYSLRVDAIKVV